MSEPRARLTALLLLLLGLSTALLPIASVDPAIAGRRDWSALDLLLAARDSVGHRTPLELALSFPGLAYLFTAVAALSLALPRWRLPVAMLAGCALLSASRAYRWVPGEVAATLYRRPPLPNRTTGLKLVYDGISIGPAAYLVPVLLVTVLVLLYATRRGGR